MIIEHQEQVTPAVLAVMERTSDPRLREIMISLITHLHGFVRDVRLTEAEFREAAAILVELGQRSNDTHNEVILMAGSLGVSSLVCLLNNGDHGNTETAQSLLGPFWRLNSPVMENGGSIVRSDTPGPPLFGNGRVVDRAGTPGRKQVLLVVGQRAQIDRWHIDRAAEFGATGQFRVVVGIAGFPDELKPSGKPFQKFERFRRRLDVLPDSRIADQAVGDLAQVLNDTFRRGHIALPALRGCSGNPDAAA